MAIMVTRVPFPSLDWSPGPHPLERKKGPVGNVVLLEFAPAFEDPTWCPRGHVIYVVSGELELQLRDGCARAAAGEALLVQKGTEHRARNPGRLPVILLVISGD